MSTRTLRSSRLPSPSKISKPKSTATSNSPSTAPSKPPLTHRKPKPKSKPTPSQPPSSAASSTPRYFLIVASRDHVRAAVDGGFVQANHGKLAPLKQMKRGDGFVFYSAGETYSPKTAAAGKSAKNEGGVCQKFTAIGRIKDDKIYQVDVNGDRSWMPFRREVEYMEGGREVEIKPLIGELDFIRDKERWGGSLRFGFLRIGEGDWRVVERRMRGEVGRRTRRGEE